MIERIEENRTRPHVKLIGTDGNAISILGRVFRALRASGWSQAEIDAFKKEATAGDYNHLLATVIKYLDVD